MLALLRDGERYSYELVRALGDADGLVTTEGTLYPLLGRLRREGAVETTWRESWERSAQMTTDTLHPLTAEYLRRLRRAGRMLPPGRLRIDAESRSCRLRASRAGPDRDLGLPRAPSRPSHHVVRA